MNCEWESQEDIACVCAMLLSILFLEWRVGWVGDGRGKRLVLQKKKRFFFKKR